MKALALIPKKENSLGFIELEKPTIRPDEILVKVLQVGVCGTDMEINQGLYGSSPPGFEYLILGHESLGVVSSVGEEVSSFEEGDLVVRVVRRPCKDICRNCENVENDMCLTGNYTEIGIKEMHGTMVEFYKEKPEFLVKIPEECKDVGVLLEPLSFVEKTVYQIMETQKRMLWEPKTALILGSGAVGLLATIILRDMGLETTTVARSKRGTINSKIVEELGGEYLSTKEKELGDKKYDLIIEATGNAGMVDTATRLLNTNGVLCLTSITGDDQVIDFPISRFNMDFVLNNKVLVGVVNANIRDYHRGVQRFRDVENKWPGLMERLITNRISLDNYKQAFSRKPNNIKTVINFCNE